MSGRAVMTAGLLAVAIVALASAQEPAVKVRAGSYLGDLRCDTCDVLRYRLDLTDDHTFALRVDAVDGEESVAMDDIGTWSVETDPPTLVLHGGQKDPLLFRVVDERTLRVLDRGGGEIVTESNLDLERTNQDLPILEPKLLMLGEYKPTASGGVFRSCRTGHWMAVVEDQGREPLDERLPETATDQGAQNLTAIEGTVVTRWTDDESAPLTGLVIDTVFDVRPGGDCSQQAKIVRLWNTYWKAIRLGDAIAQEYPGQRDLHVFFRPDGKVVGSAGCNQFMASFKASRTSVDIGPLSVSRQACPRGGEQERSMFEALDEAVHWTISDGFLELRDVGYRPVATFQAVSPR